MTRLGLDESITYDVFDYWRNEFLPPIKGDLVQTLPSGTCRVLAVKEHKPYPQIVSSSRNINQGMTDILSEHWDAKKVLSGESLVVANDPYELRIIVPREGPSWKVSGVTTASKKVKATFTQNAHEVRVTLNSPLSQKVTYQISFE